MRIAKIEIEIDLIYDSKLKFNIIKRKIRTRTKIQTQDNSRIDPIPCRIKGFSFTNLKTIVGVQQSISSSSLRNLTLDTLWMWKLI